ncbi:unnamed protein product, partial [Strongylus vulgaris]
FRRDLQGSPFDIFFLPPLQCVYKFDYYIDPEDLYDHNHDENRIQNDAYQHLFLGWKIAALSGCGSAVIFTASALLLAVCAFCHRTFICASTVLVTVAAILSSIGVSVFYAWANYQDNKVIKEEEDTIYEQILGWAFYCQVVAALVTWLASMLGCCVTSVSFSKTRAKLVKIEAIYRVDSQSLRQWERDYIRNAQGHQQRQEDEASRAFKRTTSVPNYSKKQRAAAQKKLASRSGRDLFSSTSNMTETTHTGSINTLERNQSRSISSQPVPPAIPSPHPTSKLKSALKTPQQSRKSINFDDSDITYEYLPCDDISVGVSSLSGTSDITYEYLPCDDISVGVSSLSGTRQPSSRRTYDPVYEQIGQEAYLEPDSVRQRSNLALNVDPTIRTLPASQPPHGSSQSVPVGQPKTTVIDDVARPSSSMDSNKNRPTHPLVTKSSQAPVERVHLPGAFRQKNEVTVVEKTATKSTSFPATPCPESKPPLSIREFGIEVIPKPGYCDVETSFRSQGTSDPISKVKYAELGGGKSVADTNTLSAPSPLKYISVEKANIKRLDELVGRPSTSIGKSITNLTFRPQSTTGASEVFERPDSMSLESSSMISTTPRKSPVPLKQLVHRKLLTTLPDEVDRSIGSSTIIENETMRNSTDSYARDAEIRLNLFMNDKTKDETTV